MSVDKCKPKFQVICRKLHKLKLYEDLLAFYSLIIAFLWVNENISTSVQANSRVFSDYALVLRNDIVKFLNPKLSR